MIAANLVESKTLVVTPSILDSVLLWVGCDDYHFRAVLSRESIEIETSKIHRIYRIHNKSLTGLDSSEATFAIAFQGKERECLVGVSSLPRELMDGEDKPGPPVIEITYGGFATLYFKYLLAEPTVILSTILFPLALLPLLGLYWVWDIVVLHNSEVLGFFARPGCELNCARKILSLHSLVALLFIVQLALVIGPLVFLYFQTPKYKYALNFRISQSCSFMSLILATVIFAQLIAFFPFKQYGRFIELGFDPKVERMFSSLKNKSK